MSVPHKRSDDALLKNLVPLNTLSDEQLGHLLSRIVVEKAKKGEYLFREGDTDHQNVYLLSGTIALLSGQKEMDLVSSGTPTARFALAHQLPRKHSAQAKTNVTYVRIDSRMLSDMLARSQSASYEVSDISEPSSGDWMSLLLQSTIFQQIPPANLQRVMMRMEEFQVSAGDIIVNQGDDGDFFYLISKGECSVTRTPEEGHAPVELAKLCAGKGFGEESLISEKPRSSTVTMLSDGVLVRLKKQDFIDLVKQPLSHTINYRDACKSVENGSLWLDVRTPEEYEEGHLPGAINLPFFSLRFQASSLTLDCAYIIYATEVGLSATAAYLLTERSAEVFVLDIGWAELAELAGLVKDEQEGQPQVSNVIDFHRDAEDVSAIKAKVTAQAAEIEDLKNAFSVQQTQFEEALQQRHTEVKLLKQALALAKRRQESGEQEGNEALRREIDSLQASLQNAETQATGYAELQMEHDKLLTRLNELEQQLATSREEIESTRRLGDDFRQQVIDLRSQLKQTQARYEEQKGRLKEEITELSLQLQVVEESLRESEQQAEGQHSEQERLRGELAELQATSEAFRTQSAEDLSRLSGERFELECALEQLKQEQAASQTVDNERIESLQQALEQAREAFNQTQSQQEVVLQEALKKANDSAQQAAGELEQEIASLRQSQASAQQALEETRLQLEQSQHEAQQQETALKQALMQANESAQQVAEALEQEIASLRQSQASTQEALEETRLQLDQSQHEAQQREAALQQALMQANESAQQSAGELEQEIASLRQSQASAQQALDETRLALEQSQREAQQQETALQQALMQANESAQQSAGELEQEIASLRQSQASAQQALEETRLQLEQSQHEAQQQEAALQQALMQADESAQQVAETLEQEIASLRQSQASAQQALEETRLQLEQSQHEAQQRESSLQDVLDQANTTAGENAEQFALNISQLEQQIEALQQQIQAQDSAQQVQAEERRDLQARLEAEISRVGELEQARQSLDERRQSLEKELEAIRDAGSDAEAQHHNAMSSLRSDMEQAQQNIEELRQVRQQLENSLQQTQAEAGSLRQQLNEALEAAGGKAEEEQALIDEALKGLNDQLQAAQAETSKQSEKRVELEALLEQEYQTASFLKRSLKTAEEAVELSERELDEIRQSQQTMEGQLAELQLTLANERLEKDQLNEQLQQEIKSGVQAREAQGEVEAARLAQQAAESKIEELMSEIQGLREVQLEMGSQLSDDADSEIARLRSALTAEEQKRIKAEKLAQKVGVLRREMQTQEAAVEMINNDLDEVTEEKNALRQEKEALVQELELVARQMKEIRGQYTDLVSENDRLNSEMTRLRDQASDSSLADDLLIQMEELRIKAENYETERNEALSEAKRMRREVGELRSVIETYVKQIKDVQSLSPDKQVVALRNELDMVRQQANEDLEQMRLHLQNAESRFSEQDNRDVNDVAAQQAFRQEMFSLQRALSEKDHLLRLAQNQCRGLEDAIEDRDKEVDQLKRKLELLLRKTGGMDDSSLSRDARQIADSHLSDNSRRGKGDQPDSDGDPRKNTFGRLFRK